MADPLTPAPVWKRVVASILDFLMVFIMGGTIIGKLTGNLTSGGFSLDGLPALALFALVAGYFYIGRRVMGGTLWDRFFKIARPQPN